MVANGHGAISLAALRGRPVYLNFFADWCQPCQDEGPTLRTLSAESKRRGVVMIGIATLDSIAGARRFAKKFNLSYLIVVDASSAVGAAYGVSTLPEQVFIAADGKVRSWSVGPETPARGSAALRAIATSR